MVVFCCKIRSAIWGYPGFKATTQRHHKGISGIRSKQLCAPYGVSRARWVKGNFIRNTMTFILSNLDAVEWRYDIVCRAKWDYFCSFFYFCVQPCLTLIRTFNAYCVWLAVDLCTDMIWSRCGTYSVCMLEHVMIPIFNQTSYIGFFKSSTHSLCNSLFYMYLLALWVLYLWQRDPSEEWWSKHNIFIFLM